MKLFFAQSTKTALSLVKQEISNEGIDAQEQSMQDWFTTHSMSNISSIVSMSAYVVEAAVPDMINTALGPISPDKLGITLMHEHFVFSLPGWFADATLAPDNYEKTMKTILDVIKTAQQHGVKTIVDATPNDTGGRNPALYKDLAEKTGLNIICSTGLYTEPEGSPGYWKEKADGAWICPR